MSPPSFILSFLETWVPKRSPLRWIVVNTVCLAYSTALLLITFIAVEDSKYTNFAERSYLFWDFTTTVVWCVEVGLRVWRCTELKWYLKAELGVALYFVVDSSFSLYKFNVKEEDIHVVVASVLITTAAFLYALIETIQEYREKNPPDGGGGDYQEIVDDEDEADAAGG